MTDRIREIALVYGSASEHEDLVAELEKLVQDEREACAKLFLEMYGRNTPETIAKAIRARKP